MSCDLFCAFNNTLRNPVFTRLPGDPWQEKLKVSEFMYVKLQEQCPAHYTTTTQVFTQKQKQKCPPNSRSQRSVFVLELLNKFNQNIPISYSGHRKTCSITCLSSLHAQTSGSCPGEGLATLNTTENLSLQTDSTHDHALPVLTESHLMSFKSFSQLRPYFHYCQKAYYLVL